MELQKVSFSNPASTSPSLHNRPHDYQQPATDPVSRSVAFSVCLCTCCLCCDIVVQEIVGKYILQDPCIAGDGAFKK